MVYNNSIFDYFIWYLLEIYLATRYIERLTKQIGDVDCGPIICRLFKALINNPKSVRINFDNDKMPALRKEIYDTLNNSIKKKLEMFKVWTFR